MWLVGAAGWSLLLMASHPLGLGPAAALGFIWGAAIVAQVWAFVSKENRLG